MSEQIIDGHCLCGKSRFELTGPHLWVAHCHCESCRRATASPFTTWIGHKNGNWRWTGDEPVTYESSPGAERGFCGTCGTPLFFRADRYPGETHFYAALLRAGADVQPTLHYHSQEQVPWIELSDRLPRH